MPMNPRPTSFVVVSGPKGAKRVPLLGGKTSQGTVIVWVCAKAFMLAYNAVMGAGKFTVTLAGIPCRVHREEQELLRLTCKAKAIHGVGYGVNGRVKYSRNQVATHY